MLYIVVGILAIGSGTQGIFDDWHSLLDLSKGSHSLFPILSGLFAIGVGVAAERNSPERKILGELADHLRNVKDDE